MPEEPTAMLEPNTANPAASTDADASMTTDAKPGLAAPMAAWISKIEHPQPSSSAGASPALPRLPKEDEASAGRAHADLMHAVRCFHRGDPSDAAKLLADAPDGAIPALLHPFRDMHRLRTAYPLVLLAGEIEGLAAGDDDESEADLEQRVAPMGDVLEAAVKTFAPNETDALVLRENLPRLELGIRTRLERQPCIVEMRTAIAEAGKAMVEQLGLAEKPAQALKNGLEQLTEAIPEGSMLLQLDDAAPLALFLHAARGHANERSQRLKQKVRELRRRLHDMLLVDRDKSEAGRQPNQLAASAGTAGGTFFDSDALAGVLGKHRGAKAMSAERRTRIENVIDVLDRYITEDHPEQTVVVHQDPAPSVLREAFPQVAWRKSEQETACAVAASIYDETADEFAELFAAMRIGDLELRDAYEPSRHDPLLSTFDWEAFSEEELLCLPPIVALESPEHLAGAGMLCLSRLQVSGRPVSVIVNVQAAGNLAVPTESDPFWGYRLELGLLGIAHRESLVFQSSAARPRRLLDGYRQSLHATHASLHVVASGLTLDGRMPEIGEWLYESAVLEGRAHPLFAYNPERGTTFARRFNIDGNPQPVEEWPTYELPYQAADGRRDDLDIAFTYADYALLEPRLREQFRALPAGLDDSSLVTVSAYLQAESADALEMIPYIWSVDGKGRLIRLAVSRRLAYACRDRLGYWRRLQEIAGIRNEHIQAAEALVEQRMTEEFEAEREAMQAAHAAELEEVRRSAAHEAFERLAEKLLGLDPAELGGAAVRSARATAPAARPAAASGSAGSATEAAPAETKTEEAPAAPADEADDEPMDPWVNSMLCTSCNDCLNINNRLFVYNENKQATIGDAKAGTYAQLVEAAEKCPSRCIHPGTPLNDDEPNLDELIKRAKKFN